MRAEAESREIKNEDILLSIIVPVFNNTAVQLDACFASLTNSGRLKYEIIAVDDGSNSACKNRLKSYGGKISGLRIIHQNNQGASAARNHGALSAKGKFLCFVDADDMLSQQFWKDVSALGLETISYDVIYGLVQPYALRNPVQNEEQNSLPLKEINHEKYKLLYRHMIAQGEAEFHTLNGDVVQGPVARLVKRQFFLQHLFNPDLIHGEDIIWNLAMLKDHARAAVIYHTWYYYTENQNSITRRPNKNYAKWQKNFLLQLIPYITDKSLYPAFMTRIFVSMRALAEGMYLNSMNKDSLWKKAKEFNNMTNQYPYTLIEYKYAFGIKDIIKTMFFKTHTLFWVYAVRWLICRYKR